MAVDRQAFSKAIYLKICENLLRYYLGKVKKFEKHRMIQSALKNAFSAGGAYMPPPRLFRVKRDIHDVNLKKKTKVIWKIFPSIP